LALAKKSEAGIIERVLVWLKPGEIGMLFFLQLKQEAIDNLG
jgi:hypothetical protein